MHREHDFYVNGQPAARPSGNGGLSRRSFLAAGAATAATAVLPSAALAQSALAAGAPRPRFRRIRTQFIAALGGPNETSGSNAQLWGLWRQDPGPRGVGLDGYERLMGAGGLAPAQWQFDSTDWWLEEHGLIMEKPAFPVSPGKYLVTGGRDVTTTLTIHPMGEDGIRRWELAGGATLYDVTHLRCRSARYTPATRDGSCSPSKAERSAFPVAPGDSMPPIEDCHKQDYAVLLVIGVAVEDG